MTNLGRPRDGKEIKKVYTLRLEPKVKDEIVKKYGSLTKAIEYLKEVKNEKSN